MVEMRNSALMAHEEDLQTRGLVDWLRAHTSFLKPLHRYDGELRLEEDTRGGGKYRLELDREDVTDLYHGFDEEFRRREDRSIGTRFEPLRVRYEGDERERTMYLVTDFSRLTRSSKNREWYEALREWTGSEEEG
ncbi:hypothetical protein AKJ36_00200 [candidate division MSBL1 archaeon SCGC-AAA259I07]|uniref:Uncharacterized protein n=1 Tax=candidate division MSBL1 archaeon SCGC-AAA259I07 TaxID=1698266 RepID=A0A133UMZ5_9EURY|nr:hypothetical protein AKJ36_00200 [candidate division MSBL1 archaeon SCGC-AAA259I07]